MIRDNGFTVCVSVPSPIKVEANNYVNITSPNLITVRDWLLSIVREIDDRIEEGK